MNGGHHQGTEIFAKVSTCEPAPATGEVLYLPAGVQTITPAKGPRRVTIMVDRQTAATMEAHRQAVEAQSGKRVYFDFNHQNGEASFWPVRFYWKEGTRPGVYAQGSYSESGRQAIEGRNWSEFSGRFFIDNPNGTETNPARVVVNPAASPNLGGFVNNGAFTGVALWAARSETGTRVESNSAGARCLGHAESSTRAHMKSTIEGGFSAVGALRKYAEIQARNRIPIGSGRKIEARSLDDVKAAAIEAASFYKEELKPHFQRFADMSMPEIQAADVTDANVGTLAGTLVLQQSLPLFKYNYPVLANLWTDFSATPGLLNQTENTRIVIMPAVETYDPTLDASGRPKGWTTVSPAQATDAPVKLDEYVGVPIVFGQNLLSSTLRRLFDEQGPAAIYAMAKYYVGKVTKLLTPANYNAYAQQTADGKVPDAYPTYAVALKDFSMDSMDDLEAIFDANEVPETDRIVLLNAKYHGKLRKDPRLGLFYAAMQKPDMVTDGKLPKLNGFMPIRAPWLPSANNLVGMALHKAGIVLKQRLPTDFSQALNVMIPGSVSVVMDPESGMSGLLVQYVNLQGNYAEWRLENLLGAGVGDKRGGLPLTSQ